MKQKGGNETKKTDDDDADYNDAKRDQRNRIRKERKGGKGTEKGNNKKR